MSKKPQRIDAVLDISESGDHCLFELQGPPGVEIPPQAMLDAFAEMLTAKYGLTSEDWDFPKSSLDS
jgi:hypothetical protein